MTERSHHAAPVSSVQSAPIRIVPLYHPERIAARAQAAATPHLTYNGGPLLTNVEVFTIFWGSGWKQPTQAALANNLNDFFRSIVTSSLIDQMAEYSVPGKIIGHGSFVGTTALTKPAPRKTTTDTQIRNMLQKQIATNPAFPQPTANRLYFVFLPSGITVQFQGSLSCQVFCGYHNDIGGNIFYAVMPFPDCSGCLNGSPLESLTVTSSHELCEAITDPIAGQGWYWFADQQNQGEIGDVCEGGSKQVGAFTVQKEWSNSANRCV